MIDLFRLYFIADKKRIVWWILGIMIFYFVLFGAFLMFGDIADFYRIFCNWNFGDGDSVVILALIVPVITYMGLIFKIFNDKSFVMLPASFAQKYVSRLLFCTIVIMLTVFLEWCIAIGVMRLVSAMFIPGDVLSSVTVDEGLLTVKFYPFPIVMFSLAVFSGAIMDNSGFVLILISAKKAIFPYFQNPELYIVYIMFSIVLLIASYFIIRQRNVVNGINVLDKKKGDDK